MPNEIISVVTIPNGYTADKTSLRLSLYIAPRLSGAPTLDSFPDWLNWPKTLSTGTLNVTLACGNNQTTVTVDTAPLREDVWTSIFNKDTFVDAFQRFDYNDRLIVSYPVAEALSSVKNLYQFIGYHDPFNMPKREGLYSLVGGFDVAGDEKDQRALIARERAQAWLEQIGQLPGPVQPPPSNDGDVTTSVQLRPRTATNAVARRFNLFAHIPPAPNRAPLPNTPDDFSKLLDFHQAITALQSYPELLRAFGLVLDITVPLDFVPVSPDAGNTFFTIGVTDFKPDALQAPAPQFNFPTTQYARSADGFFAAPQSNSGVPGDVQNGLLQFPNGWFYLAQIDVDGAMHQTIATAETLMSAQNRSRDTSGLATLRSGGLSLIAAGRAMQLLESMRQAKEFNDAVAAGKPLPAALTARDLIRGFRLDIWSSQTNTWCSLHRRNGEYAFGDAGQVTLSIADEEGFTQLAAVQPADDPTRPPDPPTVAGIPPSSSDIFLHERMARWNNWSLSVPRPGKALNRDPHPEKAVDDDPTTDEPATPFKMKKTFSVVKGSLPELRFGRRYRVRARAVDVAGNSIPLRDDEPGDSTIPSDPNGVPYFRYEPVSPPEIVFRELDNQDGSTLDRLVIRTHNTDPSLDDQVTPDVAERHIVPPRVDVTTAERHGMFDDATGKLKGDAATYDLITEKDTGTLPTADAADAKHTQVPLDSNADVALPYFPDPFARGAALRNLPQTPENSNGTIEGGALTYAVPTNAPQRPGSVTLVAFDGTWPDLKSFRIVLGEGNTEPRWDDANRVLSINLPKAQRFTVPLSCFMTADDLRFMGVWEWIRQYVDAINTDILSRGAADPFLAQELQSAASIFELLTRFALEGSHYLLTPSREVTLLHAVQQPIGLPAFDELPVSQNVGNPPTLQTETYSPFALVRAWRAPASTSANLVGGLIVHGESTGKVDLVARWTDPVDTGAGGPSTIENRTHVDEIPLPNTLPELLFAPGADHRPVAFYLPEEQAMWFANQGDVVAGQEPGLAAPLHDFGDTKHHIVDYTAIATSRFREYFPPAPDDAFIRSSEPITVDVPSSARPQAPRVTIVLPTFGWRRELSTNIQTSIRVGRGLRVYLDRPWFSTGAGELLGVVCWPQSAPWPTDEQREEFKPYFTQAGMDPIWQAQALATLPHSFDFSDATLGQNLRLDETQLAVDVAGHEVKFDSEKSLWYADISFDIAETYGPFIRLALARYQPHSIPNVELSHVVLADFAQLTPDRSLVVTRAPFDLRTLRVLVSGLAPEAPQRNRVDVRVQHRAIVSPSEELGWQDAAADIVTVTPDAPPPTGPDASLWSGTIAFASDPVANQYRLLVSEYERIEADPIIFREEAPARLGVPGFPGVPIPPFPPIRLPRVGERLVYLDTIPIA